MTGGFFRTDDIGSTLRRFVAQLRGSGHDIGFFAIQHGNAIFLSFGPGEDYKRFGRIGDGTPSERIFIAGVEGLISVIGGAWENAVYKVMLQEEPERPRVRCGASLEFQGIWRDTMDRAMNVEYYRTHDIGEALQKFVAFLSVSGHGVGFFAIQKGNAIFQSFGPAEDFKRYGEIGEGRQCTPIEATGVDGQIKVVGGDWENAVYKVTLRNLILQVSASPADSGDDELVVTATDLSGTERARVVLREGVEDEDALRTKLVDALAVPAGCLAIILPDGQVLEQAPCSSSAGRESRQLRLTSCNQMEGVR